jgi:hypothetical protein
VDDGYGDDLMKVDESFDKTKWIKASRDVIDYLESKISKSFP